MVIFQFFKMAAGRHLEFSNSGNVNGRRVAKFHQNRDFCLSVCVSVRRVYCGKTADWIGMPFGVVSGVGRGMGVLDGSGDRRREGDSFRGKCPIV